jgi:hypothetical protein
MKLIMNSLELKKKEASINIDGSFFFQIPKKQIKKNNV